MNEVDIDKMVGLYAEGLSARQVGDLMGIDMQKVYYYMKKRGVPRRKKTESSRLASGGTLDEHAFDMLNPESAYWLGFIVTDGTVQNVDAKRRWQMKVELSRVDRGHLEKLNSFLGSSTNIYDYPRYPASALVINSKYLVNKLGDYGVVPNKTFIARAPEGLEFDKDFYRGCIDGDGTIMKDRKYVRLGLVGALPLVTSFATFARTITGTRSNVTKARNIYRFNLNGGAAKDVINVLYNPEDVYYLDRKMRLALEFTNRPYVK